MISFIRNHETMIQILWAPFFVGSLFFCFSYVAFGLGLILPYALIADVTDYGNGRIAILGTLVHVIAIGCFWASMKLDDILYELNVELMLGVCIAEMLLLVAFSYCNSTDCFT